MHRHIQADILAAIALFVVSPSACSKQSTPQGRRTAARPGDGRGGSGATARRYRIRFDRPLKPGSRYKIEMRGSMDTESVVNGKPVGDPSNSEGYTYVAEVTVKDLHPCGKATREVHKVLKAETTRAGTTQIVVPPGTTVLAESVGGKSRFSVLNKPVSATAAKFLEFTVSLFDGSTYSTDDIYDPQRRRAVGETWKVNGTKLLAGLKKSVNNIAAWPKASEVQGTVTLVAVRRVKGVEMLAIKTETRMPNMAPKTKRMKVKSGAVAFTNTFLIPSDPRSRAASRMSLTMQTTFEYSNSAFGKSVTMVVNVLQGRRTTWSPLP